MRNLLKQSLWLSLFFFLLLFLSGRIGLFLHEFAGHALVWRLLGGKLAGFSLFLFGGGIVHFDSSPASVDLSISSLLVVDLSGMGIELLTGALLAVLAILLNINRTMKALLVSASSVLIVHSLFYLVLCAYYGSGDGRLLSSLLHGTIRQAFLFVAFGLTIAGSFVVSYTFSPAVRSWVIGCSFKKRILVIGLSVFCAGLLHATLTVGERTMVKDKKYEGMKTSQNDRFKEEELSKFITAYMKEHGREPDEEQIALVENELEKKYHQFPIEIPLGIAIATAFIAGFFLSKRRDYDSPNPMVWKDIVLLSGPSGLLAVLILVANRI